MLTSKDKTRLEDFAIGVSETETADEVFIPNLTFEKCRYITDFLDKRRRDNGNLPYKYHTQRVMGLKGEHHFNLTVYVERGDGRPQGRRQ